MRNNAAEKGLIHKSLDPFSIRNKDFWDLSAVHKVISFFIYTKHIFIDIFL